AGTDTIGVQKGADFVRITVLAERSRIVDDKVLAQQRSQIPGRIERIAGIAQPVIAVLAPAHFDHAFANAYDPLAGHCALSSPHKRLMPGLTLLRQAPTEEPE